ncbi:MAG TPA: SdrD B-like domain-containing protein, partial [Gemmataceae bacterium]|nr:SdrD B-like domain-containing protein [Gemmataceae bacterium]
MNPVVSPRRRLAVRSLEDRVAPASLGDFVWSDTNGNGVQEAGEPGLSGITMRLVRNGATVATTTTNASGQYSFNTTALAGTGYWLQFAVPAGYSLSPRDAGGNDNLDNDFYSNGAGDGWTDYIPLPTGDNTSYDAGLRPTGTAGSVGDRVWSDTNGNGLQDAGEPGVAGVGIRLVGPTGGTVATTTTNASGNYSFNTTGLSGSNYYLQLSAIPSGYTLSPLDVGTNDTIDNDFYGPGWTNYFSVVAGGTNTTLDCGLVPNTPTPSTLGDRVWKDINNNGLQDAGEVGIAGVAVRLLINNDPIAATTTDANGNYSFNTTNLFAGAQYRVEMTTPTGYVPTAANQGADDTRDSDFTGAGGAVVTTGLFNITPGVTDLTVDAGFVPAGPRVSVNDVTVTEGNEGTTFPQFTISLDAPSTEPFRVTFATVEQTATSPEDYSEVWGELEFAPGETTKTVAVGVHGDTLFEGNQTFRFVLVEPVGGSLLDDTGLGTILEDDPAPTVSIDDISVVEGNSGTTQAAFTVTLSQPAGATYTYFYTTTFGGPYAVGAALPQGDFTPREGYLTFAPGETTKQLAFPVLGDTFTEGDETFAVTVAQSPYGGGSVTGIATIIDDDPTTGTMGFTATAFGYANDANSDGVFENFLAGPGGTTVPISKTFNQLDRRGLFEFDVSRVVAGEVTDVVLTYSWPQSGGGTVAVYGYTGNGTIELADATRAGAPLASYQVEVAPGRRSVVLDRDTVLGLTGGSGWLGLRFQGTSTNMSTAIGSPRGGPTMAPVVTFRTDVAPVPEIAVADASTPEMPSIPGTGSTVLNFVVSLSQPTTVPVTVSYTTTNGTAVGTVGGTAAGDFLHRSGSVTFEPGETTKTVAVTVLTETVYELDETMFLNLYGNSFGTLVDNQGTGTIRNDDAAPVVRVLPPTVNEGNSGTTPMTFTVTLTGATAVAATVDWATSDGTAAAGSDYLAASGTVTINPGETSKTVTVDALGDTLVEADEKFNFTLSNPAHATFGTAAFEATIRNDDAPPTVSVSGGAVAEGDTGVTALPFTLTLSHASTLPVLVNYATANGTAIAGVDYTTAAGTVTFAPGETSKAVDVDVTGETNLEADETLTLTLTSATNATLGTATATGTITNDDAAPTAVAGDDQTTIEATTVSFDASASSDPDGDPLTFSWDFGDGSTGTGVAPTHTYTDNGTYTVTLTANDGHGGIGTDTLVVTVTNVGPTVTVPAAGAATEGSAFSAAGSFTDPGADTWTGTVNFGDGTGDLPLTLNPDKTFALNHTYADNGDYTVTVTVRDDDGGTDVETFAVAVGNFGPVLTVPASGTATEGSAYTGVGSFTDPGADTWTATVNYGDGTGTQPLVLNADRTFELAHAYADDGDYTVTVTLEDDDGGSDTESFAVAVANVAPTSGVAGPARGVRGQGLAFTFTAADPSPADQAEPFSYAIDWGDGATQSIDGPAAGANLAHTYTAAGTYTVTVTATDKDGGTSVGATRAVTVVAAELQNGSLFVGGTDTGEVITLRPANTAGGISVAIAGSTVGTFTPTAGGRIVVYAQGGNDTVELLSRRIGSTTYRLNQRAVLDGGAGDDVLDARQAVGNEVLVGGAGA